MQNCGPRGRRVGGAEAEPEASAAAAAAASVLACLRRRRRARHGLLACPARLQLQLQLQLLLGMGFQHPAGSAAGQEAARDAPAALLLRAAEAGAEPGLRLPPSPAALQDKANWPALVWGGARRPALPACLPGTWEPDLGGARGLVAKEGGSRLALRH